METLEQFNQLLRSRKIDGKYFDIEAAVNFQPQLKEKTERLRKLKLQETDPWFFIKNRGEVL